MTQPQNPNNNPEVTPGEHPRHIDPNMPQKDQPAQTPNQPAHPQNPNNDPEVTPGEHPRHIDPNMPKKD